MNVKDIDLNIGEDFGMIYAVQDDNVDLTGFKSVFAIRKRASGPLVIKVQGVASGKIATFNISGKDTLEIKSFGEHVYDAFAYKESEPSRYYKLGMGVVNIIQDVAMHD